MEKFGNLYMFLFFIRNGTNDIFEIFHGCKGGFNKTFKNIGDFLENRLIRVWDTTNSFMYKHILFQYKFQLKFKLKP